MSRRSWSWCWAVVLLLLLGPAGEAVYASESPLNPCGETSPQPWKKKSPDGRFSLALKSVSGEGKGPDLFVLWLLRGATPVWQLVVKDPIAETHTWISPDGRHVLLLRYHDELTLVGPDGRERDKWTLRGLLSEAEQTWLPRGTCGMPQWLTSVRAERDAFVVEVPTGLLNARDLSDSEELRDDGLSARFLQPEHRRTSIRIDLKTAKLVREGELFRQRDVELIKAFEAELSPERSLRIVDELLGRTQTKEHVKDRELQAFWKKLLQAQELSPRLLHRMAVEAVAAMGTEGEIRALARLPGEVEARDAAVLDVLIRRFPEEAGEYALRVLEGRHPGKAVRQGALRFLLNRPGAAGTIAEEFALQDESPDLRRLGLQSLLREPITEPRFQQALMFCEEPLPLVRSEVTGFALKTLSSTGEPSRQGLVEVLQRSESRFSAGCPELVLALGAITHLEGEKAQALELYARGLRLIQEVKEPTQLVAPELRLEARLQLALEAEQKGERAEAERHAREVLADPSGRILVCAPKPSAHANYPGAKVCVTGHEAAQVARELLGRLKSKGRGGSAPSAPGRAR